MINICCEQAESLKETETKELQLTSSHSLRLNQIKIKKTLTLWGPRCILDPWDVLTCPDSCL